MATPLAGLLLISALAAGAEQACPLDWVDPPPRVALYGAGEPVCARALALRGDFEKLLAAAKLRAPVTLWFHPLLVENASYLEAERRLTVYYGFMLRSTRTGLLYVLAHELGHAVQADGPGGAERARAWTRRMAAKRHGAFDAQEQARWSGFSRRHEAQADAIAQELLAAAGFPPDTARRGEQSTVGCSLARDPGPDHPADAQRAMNLSLGEELLARPKGALSGPVEGFFDGALARVGLADPAAPGLQPRSRLSDFDGDGRLMPGRLVAGDLNIAVPVPGAPAVTAVLGAAQWGLVDTLVKPAFAAAVDRLARQRTTALLTLRACGAAEADELAEQGGVWAWSRRIALSLLEDEPAPPARAPRAREPSRPEPPERGESRSI